MGRQKPNLNIYGNSERIFANFYRDSKNGKAFFKLRGGNKDTGYKDLPQTYRLNGLFHKISFVEKTLEKNDGTISKKRSVDIVLVDREDKEHYEVSFDYGIFAVQLLNRMFAFKGSPKVENDDIVELRVGSLNKKDENGNWIPQTTKEGKALSELKLFTSKTVEGLSQEGSNKYLGLSFWYDEKSEQKCDLDNNSEFQKIVLTAREYGDKESKKPIEFLIELLKDHLIQDCGYIFKKIDSKTKIGIEFTNPYVNKLLLDSSNMSNDISENISAEMQTENDEDIIEQEYASADTEDDLPF